MPVNVRAVHMPVCMYICGTLCIPYAHVEYVLRWFLPSVNLILCICTSAYVHTHDICTPVYIRMPIYMLFADAVGEHLDACSSVYVQCIHVHWMSVCTVRVCMNHT